MMITSEKKALRYDQPSSFLCLGLYKAQSQHSCVSRTCRQLAEIPSAVDNLNVSGFRGTVPGFIGLSRFCIAVFTIGYTSDLKPWIREHGDIALPSWVLAHQSNISRPFSRFLRFFIFVPLRNERALDSSSPTEVRLFISPVYIYVAHWSISEWTTKGTDGV